MLALMLLAVFGRIAVALTTSAFPGLDRRASCPIEDKPWLVQNLVVFTAAAHKDEPAKRDQPAMQQQPKSFLAFEFHDNNVGLELQTSCYRDNDGTSIADPDKYYLCDDENVRYKFDGKSLQIARGFKSDCLGKPPYDHGNGHGSAELTLVQTQVLYGSLGTQAQLSVPISRLSKLKAEE